MKRKIVIVAIVMLLTLTLVAGCTEQEKSGIAWVQDLCDAITQVKTIDQKIEIKQNAMTPYTSEKHFVRTETGFDMTGTETKQSEVGSEAPTTTTTLSETYTFAQNVVPTLHLDETYFSDVSVSTTTGLTGTVKADKLKDLISLSDDVEAPSGATRITLTASTQGVTGITLSYRSGTYDVTITLTFEY